MPIFRETASTGSTSNSVALSVAAENTTTSLKSGILNGGIGGTLTPGTTLDYGDPSNELAFTANVAGVSELLPTTGTVTFTEWDFFWVLFRSGQSLGGLLNISTAIQLVTA